MEEQLFKLATSNGLWATLFVFLFLYVLYDGKVRERKYQETIENNNKIIKELSTNLGIVKDIQDDVVEIRFKIS